MRTRLSWSVCLNVLTLVRGYGFDHGREPGMNFRVNRPIPHLGACGVFAKKIIAFPILRRSDGPWNKATAAVRAHVFQDLFDARRAKCALVAADTRFKRIGRQVLVAVLACRSQ